MSFIVFKHFSSGKICFFITVRYYHVTYAFQSESTLYDCLNVKERIARKKRDNGSLSDLVRKRTRNHLAKLSK